MTERNLAAHCEAISRARHVVIDIESTGLDPYVAGDRAVGVAVLWNDVAEYFPERHEGGGNLPEGTIGKVLRAVRGKVLGGWNLRFDLSMLSFEPDGAWCLSPDVETEDGIVDALLMNENEPSFSLDAIAAKYLGAEEAASKGKMDALLAERFPAIRSARARKGNLWRLPAADVADYARLDTWLPYRLRAKFAPALEAWGLTALAREMNAYSLLLARMQRAGVPIDVERCRRLSASTEERKARLLEKIRSDLCSPKFNPSSWQQVVAVTGTENAREETLEASGHPVAADVVTYKKLGKAKAAYYDAILRGVDPAGVLHPQLNLTRDPTDVGGARTGRLSCSRPPFQALPHADADPTAIYQVRDLVVPRPGHKLAKLDYERAEMWMGASYCREPNLVAAYESGRDIYTEMADKLSLRRHQAKILFLMLQYGAGVWKVARSMGWEGGEWTEKVWFEPEKFRFEPGFYPWGYIRAFHVREDFFALYPRIRAAMNAYARTWEDAGSLRLWTGRAIHYPGNRPYAAWNRVIQGAVAEMIRHAMQRLEAPLANLGARMLLQVHDELVVEYPESEERAVVPLCVEVMTDFDQFLLRPRVEAKVSATNYAQMETYR